MGRGENAHVLHLAQNEQVFVAGDEEVNSAIDRVGQQVSVFGIAYFPFLLLYFGRNQSIVEQSSQESVELM